MLVNFLLSAMNSTEPRTAFVRMAMISTIGIVGNYVAALVVDLWLRGAVADLIVYGVAHLTYLARLRGARARVG